VLVDDVPEPCEPPLVVGDLLFEGGDALRAPLCRLGRLEVEEACDLAGLDAVDVDAAAGEDVDAGVDDGSLARCRAA
jgi:hypothetical protein